MFTKTHKENITFLSNSFCLLFVFCFFDSTLQGRVVVETILMLISWVTKAGFSCTLVRRSCLEFIEVSAAHLRVSQGDRE